MIDIVTQINDIRREVGSGRLGGSEARSVILRRRYDAEIEDVWDACTNAERIPRWFLPVSGDLRLGGKYQLEGNAGGEIVKCEPPRLLRVTWVFGELPPSEVEVRLSAGAGGDTTDFELEHIAIVDPEHWVQFGPGAVGVGWDLTLLGLGLHLRGGGIDNPGEWLQSPEAKAFMTRSSDAWRVAHEASGADPTEAAAMAQRTLAVYTGDPSAN
ncbi:MAG TPA: SRPBCC family protein [Actinophytocola sp.]|uniref:SRPBCC family protein n=1 Tax=Actinophytocola sp. TaxID=1872138 RepID=UPI002DDD583B|nr:SRPBCC family protein [Actinophytocola sp.]HEV2778010.1 SRPBCC family protein [Actinophytocola sp.]